MKFAELTFSRAGSLGRVMTSRAVSTYANQVIAFVIRWLVLSCTGSVWNAGVTAFAMGLASLVRILMAGLIIDRMGGRKMSVVAAGLSFVTAAALATALLIDFLLLWFVIVSQGFGVFFDGLGPIAKNTLVPEASQRRRCPRNHGHSATTALLACAIGMGLVSIGTLLLPFMKLLDDKQSPDVVNKRTNFDQYRNKI